MIASTLRIAAFEAWTMIRALRMALVLLPLGVVLATAVMRVVVEADVGEAVADPLDVDAIARFGPLPEPVVTTRGPGPAVRWARTSGGDALVMGWIGLALFTGLLSGAVAGDEARTAYASTVLLVGRRPVLFGSLLSSAVFPLALGPCGTFVVVGSAGPLGAAEPLFVGLALAVIGWMGVAGAVLALSEWVTEPIPVAVLGGFVAWFVLPVFGGPFATLLLVLPGVGAWDAWTAWTAGGPLWPLFAQGLMAVGCVAVGTR